MLRMKKTTTEKWINIRELNICGQGDNNVNAATPTSAIPTTTAIINNDDV